MRADLVEDALSMAIVLRGELPEQVIFHSDYAEDDVKPRNRPDAPCLQGTGLTFSA